MILAAALICLAIDAIAGIVTLLYNLGVFFYDLEKKVVDIIEKTLAAMADVMGAAMAQFNAMLNEFTKFMAGTLSSMLQRLRGWLSSFNAGANAQLALLLRMDTGALHEGAASKSAQMEQMAA